MLGRVRRNNDGKLVWEFEFENKDEQDFIQCLHAGIIRYENMAKENIEREGWSQTMDDVLTVSEAFQVLIWSMSHAKELPHEKHIPIYDKDGKLVYERRMHKSDEI